MNRFIKIFTEIGLRYGKKLAGTFFDGGRELTAFNVNWEKDNGLSVLKARDCIKENFILLMGDHLFDSELLSMLIKLPLGEGEISEAFSWSPLMD